MASTSTPAQVIAIDRDLVEQIVWGLFSVSDWLYDTNSTALADLADWLGSTVEDAKVFTHELWTLGRVTHRLLKSAGAERASGVALQGPDPRDLPPKTARAALVTRPAPRDHPDEDGWRRDG